MHGILTGFLLTMLKSTYMSLLHTMPLPSCLPAFST